MYSILCIDLNFHFDIIPITVLYCFFSSQLERRKCDKVVECDRSQVNILSNSKYIRTGLCCIPVNEGINFFEAWATKYSDLYEIVHSSFDLVSFICVCKTGIQKRVK